MRQIALLLLFVVSVGCSQNERARIIERFDSSEDTTRMIAFYELLDSAKAGQPPARDFPTSTLQWASYARKHNDVALASIRLLERENHMMFLEGGTGSEEISNYYGDLIGHVAALENPQAARALIGAITTGGMATDGLAALGDVAIPRLERLTRSADHEKRSGSMYALGAMVDRPSKKLSPGGLAQARRLLRAGLKDRHYSVRVAAIFALSNTREADVAAENKAACRVGLDTDNHWFCDSPTCQGCCETLAQPATVAEVTSERNEFRRGAGSNRTVPTYTTWLYAQRGKKRPHLLPDALTPAIKEVLPQPPPSGFTLRRRFRSGDRLCDIAVIELTHESPVAGIEQQVTSQCAP